MALREPPALGTPMLPPKTFEGEVVVVTGGGTGIGRAIAIEFGRLGASVAIASRSAEHRASGVAAVEGAGGRAAGVALDVRDAGNVAAAFDQIEAELGPVAHLINNAAGNFPVAAEDTSANAWRAVTQIVLDGTFFCSSEFARRRIAASQGGSILNIGASYAWTGGPGHAHSAAAKSGVWNLTMSLAVEWAPDDIRVNGLVPGLFPTDDHPDAMRAIRVGASEEERARRIPGGRVGRLRELGWAATYLCSPFAAYLTGHWLVLDGANWLRRNVVMPEFTPVRDTIPKREKSSDREKSPKD
jgi:NAD(P)-dependent dehydrogenase (short-subunit alcohol dehydrogenase family)